MNITLEDIRAEQARRRQLLANATLDEIRPERARRGQRAGRAQRAAIAPLDDAGAERQRRAIAVLEAPRRGQSNLPGGRFTQRALGSNPFTAPLLFLDKPFLDEFLRKQTFADRAVNAALFNLGDEAVAGVAAGIGGGAKGVFDAVKERDIGAIGRSVGDDFRDIRRIQAAREDLFEKENPGQALGADIVGGAVGGGKLNAALKGAKFAKGLLGGSGLGSVAGRSAIEGGAFAFGDARGSLAERAPEALLGAAFGAGGGTVANKASELPAIKKAAEIAGEVATPIIRRATRKANDQPRIGLLAPQVKKAAEEQFAIAEAAGVRIGADQTNAFSEALRRTLAERRALNKKGKILERFRLLRAAQETVAESAGSSATPVELLAIREGLEAAAKSTDEGEKLIGKALLENFDDFSGKLSPELNQASDLFRRAARTEIIDDAIAAAKKGAGNDILSPAFTKTLKAEFKGIADKIDTKTLTDFTPAEIKAIRDISEGTPLLNNARRVGSFAPDDLKDTAALATPFGVGILAGAPAPGGIVSATIAAIGAGGRALASELSIEAATTAQALIAFGVAPAVVRRMSIPRQEALAAILASKLAEPAAGSLEEAFLGDVSP